MAKLTPKQLQFCREYLIDFNATQSAIRAGYSEKTAGQIGEQNLKKLEIQQEIERLQNERNQRLDVDADYVLKRLVEVDKLDILDILDDTGNFKPFSEWTKEWRLNISSFEVVETATGGLVKKIKFPDKVKNLELLGKHIQVGAWVNNQSIDLNANIKAEVTTLSDILDEIENES